MYKGYKVVANTAAGRRRYMRFLIPRIIVSDIIDRYDIWINTHNMADIEFFKALSNRFPKIRLVWQPEGVVDGIKSINSFYRSCVDTDTIYFKLDDDIVWMEPNLIEKMVEFRLANPDCFIVSPLVINNALSTYLLQIEGKVSLKEYCGASSSHPILWGSGRFAKDLHRWFIDTYLMPRRISDLYIGKKGFGITRFSINAILWFGKDLARINGVVPGDDEEFLSCIYPSFCGKVNAINGDAIVSHFAFFSQREDVDSSDILTRYSVVYEADRKENALLNSVSKQIDEVLEDVSNRERELMGRPSPYTKSVVSNSLKSRIKKIVPKPILQLLEIRRVEKAKQSSFLLFMNL